VTKAREHAGDDLASVDVVWVLVESVDVVDLGDGSCLSMTATQLLTSI